MNDVVKFTPKSSPNPDKCQPGDPGTITTADGDVLNVGTAKEITLEDRVARLEKIVECLCHDKSNDV